MNNALTAAVNAVKHLPAGYSITRTPHGVIWTEGDANQQDEARDAARWRAMREQIVGVDFGGEHGELVALFKAGRSIPSFGAEGADSIADAAIAAQGPKAMTTTPEFQRVATADGQAYDLRKMATLPAAEAALAAAWEAGYKAGDADHGALRHLGLNAKLSTNPYKA